jgi:hypothetical protein
MRARILLSLAAAVMLSAPAMLPGVRAADTDADSVRQKADEIDRLKRDLERAEKELKQLKDDNDRLRKQQDKQEREKLEREKKADEKELDRLKKENEQLRKEQQSAVEAASKPARELKPAPPVGNMPPLTKDTVVEAEVLVAQFLAEPAAAAARYNDQVFRVTGEPERFSAKVFVRDFDVLLLSPDRNVMLKCSFNYIEKSWSSVFTEQSGRKLTARYPSGRKELLAETGQRITILGRCQGLKKDELGFDRCQFVN